MKKTKALPFRGSPKADGALQRQDVKPLPVKAGSDQIYGLIPVLEALRAGRRQLEQITVAEGARHERMRELLEKARQARVPVHRVPRSVLARSAGSAHTQGVVARISAARYREAEELLDQAVAKMSQGSTPIILALDGLEDPHNFGAILRTAECAGVDAVFVPERRAVGLTETVAKAAAGAVEYMAVARVPNFVRLIEQLKERNIWVVGGAADGAVNYTGWDWTLPTAVFLGSEGEGLHRLVRERCDALLRIPVVGHLDSLNVSVAAGVFLYEALRQRS
ncbi:MAG TPA: 23S rRNA (guanosine(2251)-2'-O)-methyltransferase RlmB [Pyrinomonadaceae bacterium]|nr:23S rRNA (guanosine(2251)-2'-O)-methyltransferase RlmB [Pyrinomonadaceae bacterium]